MKEHVHLTNKDKLRAGVFYPAVGRARNLLWRTMIVCLSSHERSFGFATTISANGQ